MSKPTIILGIETSCDETGTAIVVDGVSVAECTTTQTLHQKYGGVVPELASRAHEKLLAESVRLALTEANLKLTDLSAIAATIGPGLAGALLVGASYAKGLAQAVGVPFIGVNHIEGHLWAAELEGNIIPTPFLAMIVSGGHTLLIRVDGFGKYTKLGSTRDDAAGELFDKTGRMMGISFPAGETLDQMALEPDIEPVRFPRARLKDESLNFSFSGLKTAVLYHLRSNFSRGEDGFELSDDERKQIAKGMLDAVADMLVSNMARALANHEYKAILVGGGVSASQFLRRRWKALAAEYSLPLFIPSPSHCADNGSMIANIGYHKFLSGEFTALDCSIYPSLSLCGD